MSVLIVADVHGNLPALEAVLATPQARGCDCIISLGDHVNFGPQSRAVHERLCGLGARMLLGNHEERLTRPGDGEFDGYNWRLLRFTAEQMRGVSLTLPADLRLGSVLCTHGTPGDPYHLVHPPELPQVLEGLPEGVRLLLSGHNHHAWDVTHNGRRAFNPGSVGLAEDGVGGVAAFAVLEGETITRYTVPYDVDAVIRAYLTTGACRIAPEMCRACVRVMQTAEYQGVLKLLRHVACQGDLADRAAWEAADRTYPWAEPLTSPAYWNMMKEKLL